MGRNRCLALLVLCSSGLVGACHHVEPGTAIASEGTQAPPGEVWLTSDQSRDAKVATAIVGEQDIDTAVLTSGRVTFEDDLVAHIYSPVTGRVGSVDAALGQRLKKGTRLATIQSPDVGQASADLNKSDADLIAAKHDFDRKRDLYEAKACSAADFEASEDAFRQAKAERSRAEQKASLLRAGGIDLVSQGYVLTSPIDGEVISRNLNPGIEVQGQYGGGTAVELFTVGELNKVWVMADVYESDLSRVAVGAKVRVSVLAYPGKAFEGTVDWVSGTLDPQTRTARVRCTFDNAERKLKPEMYVSARIVATQPTRALAIPRSALVKLGDQAVVFVQMGAAPDGRSRFERVPLAVDDVAPGDFVPVEHGLEAGAKVVVSGAQALAATM